MPTDAMPPSGSDPLPPPEVAGGGPQEARRPPRWLLALEARYERLCRSRYLAHPWAPSVGLLGAVVVFSVVVGWIWASRYWAFETAAYDLGAYSQAMFTTFAGHRLFYYTLDLPAGTNGYLFASHFTPFLALLLPFYAIAPNPSGLLVIQAVGLALGVIPVYYLARRHLGPGAWPALFAGIYLLSPLTIGTGWYDFHPEAFLPVTGLTAFYFYEERRLYPFLGAWVLTLTVIETVAPFLLVFAAVGLLAALVGRRSLGNKAFRTELTIHGAALACAAAWLGLAVAVTFSISSTGGTFGPGYGGAWSILGAPSILGVYPRALASPGSALAALAHDGGLKLLYVVVVFGGLAFLPFVGKLRYLLPALAWIGLAVLSNHVGYYVVNDQYLGYMLPFLFPAAITGAARLRSADLRGVRTGLRSPAIGGLLVAGVVLTSVAISPFLAVPVGSFNAVPHGLPVLTPDDALTHRVIGMIPSNASVLTTSFLFPEVSDRADAYVLPVSSLFVDNRTYQEWVDQYVNESEYVLVDYLLDYPDAVLLARSANLSGFGLEAAAQGAYLYARGYGGPPSLWVPVNDTMTGIAVSGVPGGLPAWQGLSTKFLPPGTYRVSAQAEVNTSEPGPQASFTVAEEPIAVNETIRSVSNTSRDYLFTLEPPGAPVVLSNQSVFWNGSGSGILPIDWTYLVNWTGPGVLSTQGALLSPAASERVVSVSIVQLTAT